MKIKLLLNGEHIYILHFDFILKYFSENWKHKTNWIIII